MLSDQQRDLKRAYADLTRLRDAGGPHPDEFLKALDTLDATLAHLGTTLEDQDEKNLGFAAAHARFRALFELAPDAFLITDARGVIQEANASATELFQRALLYLVGKPLRNYVAESDSRAFLAHLNELARATRSLKWDMEIAIPNGTYLTVMCHASSSIDLGGTPASIYWLIHDVTERARYERRMAELNAELERRVADRTAQLARAETDLRNLARKLISIQEDERIRISRELHDETGQVLIALRMNLDALREDTPLDQPELRDRLLAAGEIAFRTVEQLRALAQDLRPAAIDVVDLDALLAQMCHETHRAPGFRSATLAAPCRPSIRPLGFHSIAFCRKRSAT